MLADTRVLYVFLYVRDLAASRAFYAGTLGLRVIEEDEGCVKFDAGHTILALNRAADYGIVLPDVNDHSTDVVWLVDDVRQATENLSARGVVFKPTDWYQPGGIADFYDPDGRWLTLYQPSDEALGWPSGERIRAIVEARRGANGGSTRQAVSLPPAPGAEPPGLDGAELVYLFTFVPSSAVAQAFYHEQLGLEALEGGPCSRTSGGDEEGVVKYDTGGVIIATHHVEPERSQEEFEEHLCPPPALQEGRMKGVAPVFHSTRADEVARELAARRPGLEVGVTRSAVGTIVRVDDPTGHLLFVYQPSEAALRTPSGRKIREILEAPLSPAAAAAGG
ncbi:MAG TPA: VOC family protein [Longimicrobium sp.]|nr:VOC family protein [Longimicrobium sp.]